MAENQIAIREARETVFFGRAEDGRLRQWVTLTAENRAVASVRAIVEVTAGGETVTTALELHPGVRDYRCYAPVLWPNRPADPKAHIRLVADGAAPVQAVTSVGDHRPWTVYLLSDICTDYSWVYATEAAFRSDDAAVTLAEIELAERTAGGPEENANHYNFVVASNVLYFLEHYPNQAGRLFEHIRRGNLTLNPIYNMAMTCSMSLEELIRQFYPARSWALEHGLDIGYANHQETPTIAWAMATVLAESGIGRLVKSILPYECPWAARIEEPPVFTWEGPDGSRISVRHRNKDYVEGNFVLHGLRNTNTALHDSIIPQYERAGGQYPLDAIALEGCYGDLAPNSMELPAKKTATIAAYNAQGWEYPRLVNASHKQFWDDLEDQVTTRRISLPVYRGDYGSSWDVWPVSLARDFAAWRRAQERAATADKLAAILSQLDPAWYRSHHDTLADGWLNVTNLADHAWNGANDANRYLNAQIRRRWQEAAHAALDSVISGGLAALGSRVPTGPAQRVLVFNGLGWDRSGAVRVEGLPEGATLVDAASGEVAPSQVVLEGGRPGRTATYLLAQDVPSVGYRTYEVVPPSGRPTPKGTGPSAEQPAQRGLLAATAPMAARDIRQEGGNCLEGPYYRVEVSTVTGGIASLFDKVRGVELVDKSSPYHLNQCLYLSDGVEHTPQAASVVYGPCGPVVGQLLVRSALKHTTVTTTITLYAELDRVDIRNEVQKTPTSEKQELDFAFPFAVPDRQYRFEAPGAIITPGAEQRQGAGQAVTAVRHFVDIFNERFGVTLSQADSGVAMFGHRTTMEDPLEPDPANSTVLALALCNMIDWNEITRDQAGESRFTFRYSLGGHSGGFDPTRAIRFGWEDNNELLAVLLPPGQTGDLPGASHSFVRLGSGSPVLFTLKPGEEGGVIARLWEPAGQDKKVRLVAAGMGTLRGANLTDLLERDRTTLEVGDGGVTIPVRARGLASARLSF